MSAISISRYFLLVVLLVISFDCVVFAQGTETDQPAQVFSVIPDVCPSLLETYEIHNHTFTSDNNNSNSTITDEDDHDGDDPDYDTGCVDDNTRYECTTDYQCKVGSKCCLVDRCSHRRCVDLVTGAVSDPKKVSSSALSLAPVSPKKQRRRRQVVGCVSCSVCIRNCRTNAQCIRRYGRARKHCYLNSCSSYCIA